MPFYAILLFFVDVILEVSYCLPEQMEGSFWCHFEAPCILNFTALWTNSADDIFIFSPESRP